MAEQAFRAGRGEEVGSVPQRQLESLGPVAHEQRQVELGAVHLEIERRRGRCAQAQVVAEPLLHRQHAVEEWRV